MVEIYKVQNGSSAFQPPPICAGFSLGAASLGVALFIGWVPVGTAAAVTVDGVVFDMILPQIGDDFTVINQGGLLNTNGFEVASIVVALGGVANVSGGTTVTRGLRAQSGGHANVDSSTLTGALGVAGLAINTATAVVHNSTITGGSGADAVSLRGGSATIVDSQLTGIAGAAVDVGGIINLDNSVVHGYGDAITPTIIPGGVVMYAGQINIRNGSQITSEAYGAYIQEYRGVYGSTLTVDASSVTGAVTGIQIGGLGYSSIGNVSVTNGSLIRGGSGLALNVVDRSQANVQASDSTFDGSLAVTDSQATIGLTRTVVNGGIIADSNSTVAVQAAGSVVTGDVRVDAGSTLGLNLANTTLTGNTTVGAGSTLDLKLTGSTLEGGVSSDGTGSTTVALEGSHLNGGVLNVDSLSLAAGSVMTGNVSNDVGGSTTVSLQASQLNGDVHNVSSLNLTGSVMNGNVSTDAATLPVTLQGSQLNGNVLNVGTLSLAGGSVMNGTVSNDGVGSTAVTLQDSQLTGDARNVSTLDLAGSVMNGTVSNDGVGSTAVTLQDSQLTGDARNVSTLHLAGSVMNGTVSNDGVGSTAVTLQDSQLTGNVVNVNSLALSGQSLLTGTLTQVGNATLADSTWVATGDSSVQSLTLGDSTVALGTAGQFYRLSLGSLAGTGTFKMNVDFGQDKSGFIDVSGQASGQHQLLLSASGTDPATGNPMQVVHTGAGSTAEFSLLGGPVNQGTYSYELIKHGTDWFLDPGTETISPGTASVLALFNTAPTVWYGELTTLRSRMGELRYGGSATGGWMRAYGNQYNVSTSSGVGYRQNQQGLAFGADAPLPFGDGQWLVGVMGGYSDSSLNLAGGTQATVDSYYLGAYGTWMDQASGYYVDSVVKFNRFQNSSKVAMSDGTRSKGNYTNSGVGASVEVGRHLDVGHGYFIEPYTQLAGVVIGGADYQLDNGMQADGDRTHSLLGKLGTTAGRTFDLGGGKFVQPYVRAAVAHEFANNNRVAVNGNGFNNDLSGSRGELGTGVALSLSKGLQVHVDLDYSNGTHIEQPWGANVGVRYNW